MLVRHVLVRIHRYVGLVIAAFLIVAGLTGAIIPFHDELDRALNPTFFSGRAGERLGPSALAAAVESTDPDIRAAFVEVDAEIGRSAIVFVEPRGGTTVNYNQVFVDPTSGKVLGRRQHGGCCFQREAVIPFLYNLHRRLAMPGHWGDWLMGGVAVLWTLDCFVALVLTFPLTRPFLALWAPAWRIKATSSPYRKTFDLHRAGGLWFWGVMLLIALSSVYLNLGTEVFRPVVALFSPLTPTAYDTVSQPPLVNQGSHLSFDEVLVKASDHAIAQGWQNKVRGIYDDREAGFYVVDFGTGRESGLGPSWLIMDAATGVVLSDVVPGEGTAGDLIVQLQFPIHSGRILDLPGRIIVSIAGVVVAVLSVTGLVVWAHKKKARDRRRLAGKTQGKVDTV